MASDRAAFVNWAVPWAVEASRRTGVPWQTIVAQWAFETGWGTSPMFRESHNLAGLKRASTMKTAPVRPGGTFRHYPGGFTESLDDWVRCMSLTRYAKVRAAGNVQDACRELGLAGWDARLYRGAKDANQPGHALVALLPAIAKLAPFGGPIDVVPVV